MAAKCFLVVLVIAVFGIACAAGAEDFKLNSGIRDDSLEELDFGSGGSKQPVKFTPPPKQVRESLRNVKPLTWNDLPEDLDKYVAPVKLQKSMPYYLSGYDEEDRPIWIAEVGKMDIRPFIQTPEDVAVLDKFIAQIAFRILQSLKNATAIAGREITEVMYIADMDGLNLGQVGHIPTVTWCLRALTMYRNLITDHLGGTYVINANALISVVLNLVRPIFGEAMEKVEVYGSNKARWMPVLKGQFPAKVIPTWYGGVKGYKPMAVFG